MRKWAVATTLVVVGLFAVPAAAIADGGEAAVSASTSAPQCPALPGAGVTIVNISPELMLAWDEAKASAGPVPVALEPGTYAVEMFSWDAHSTKPQQAQTKEQWFLELWAAAATTPMTTSATTPDLPEELDLAGYQVGNVTITQAAVAVRAVHAAYPDEFEPHSVAPLCAVFRGTGTDGTEGNGTTNGNGTSETTDGTQNNGTNDGNGTDRTQGNGTTEGTAAAGGTTSTTGGTGTGTADGSDEVAVLSSGPAAQSLQQLPLTGIGLEAGLVALLAMLAGIALLRRSQAWQSRLDRRNARVWRRPVR